MACRDVLTGKESPSQILQGGGTAYSAWCRRPSLSIHRHRLPFSERVQILPIDPISELSHLIITAMLVISNS
uniref:Uncharacterized protein n=1 Tax=Oryza barthii TaxID=65489 RepID=A0A0D3G8V9_9ORYZ